MEGKCTRILLKLASCMLIACFSLMNIAWGQQVTGAITGQVTDPTGAPVASASVTARDVARGTTSRTTSNNEGYYNLPRVPAGEYEVRVEVSGFQTAVRPPFRLELNQSARLDFTMKLGQVSEQVEVTGAAPLLQTESTQLGTVIDSKTNENLPLASRNYVQLTLLAPGAVTPSPSGFTNGVTTGLGPGGGAASRPYINGNHEQANNFMLDGMDNNQVSDNLTGYTPNSDAIQEFNMITQNASAEFGNFQGGIVNATIKSGTNQFRGDIFEFFRNDVLNANTWQNNWNNNPKDKQRWNQFGGVVGGPIKRDKLFFFADYQGQRFDVPSATGPTTVFTAAERRGDFSALLNAPTPYQLKNPFNPDAKGNPTPFPGNQIPLSMIDPVAKNLFASNLYPAPTNGGLKNNFYNTTATAINQDQGDIKVDYVMGEKDRLFGRYSRLFANDPGTNSFALFADAFTQNNAHNGVLNWTHTFSPTFINELRTGVNYVLVNNGYDHKGIGNLGQQLGIGHANDAGAGLLALNFNNGYVAGIGNGNSGNQQLFASTVIQFDDGAVITKGRHIFHAGFQFMRDRINVYYASNSGNLGNIGFSGQYSGSGESDFFLGLPNTFGRGGSDTGTWGQRSSIFAGYIQDDFRITDTLTLNIGVRYENHTPWVEVKDRQANFGLLSGQLYLAGQGSCPYSNCRALYNSYNLGADFQPRVGFAWSPKAFGHKTVFRGAYTMSSYLEGTGTNLRLPINPPIRQAEVLVSYPATKILPATTTDQGLILPPPGDPYRGATLRVWNPDIQPAVVQQWSFTIQHQFSNTMTLQASYVGQHGTHLMEPLELSQDRLNADGSITPSPYLAGNPAIYNDVKGAGGVFKGTASVGNQSYNALQTVLQKRLSSGLQLQVAYTYSKCMTDNGGYYGSWGSTQALPGNTYWQNLYDQKSEWGPCYYDQKHNLTSYALYELPVGKNRKFGKGMSPVLNAVAGNWNVSAIATAHTGFAMTPWTWSDTSGTGQFFETRLNCVSPASTVNTPYAGGGIQWFNPNSFAEPSTGHFGNCGNGTVRGPGLKDLDVSLQKEFPFTETKRLQFRADFINLTNTPALNAPQGTSGGGLGVITGSQGARNIQLGLKLYF